MTFKHVIALALATTAATPALAQDDTVEANFSGPRIEGRVGYEFNSIAIRDVREFNGRGNFGTSPSGEDVTAGAELGYDYQMGRLVLGAYVGIDYTDGELNSPRQPITFETGRNITAGVRVGYAFSGGMVYAKGGYSNGRLEPVFNTGANQAPFANFSENRNGYHLGGGLEFPVMGNFYVRTDYTFSRYERFRLSANDELRFSRHQLTGAIGIRF